MEFLFILIGVAVGLLIGWLWLRQQQSKQASIINDLERSLAVLQNQRENLETDKQRLINEQLSDRVRNEEIRAQDRQQFDLQTSPLRNTINELTDKLARREAEQKALQERLDEQKDQLNELQERFSKEFELLANRIFDEKSQKFTEQNRTQLDGILKPLGEKLKEFEKKVNDTHIEDTKERASLREQLMQLHQLNKSMSEEARSLTRALKGDSKAQGNWGEYILDTVLEKSGLVREREYTKQRSLTNEEGSRVQPDVIINLPDSKHLVIDSKVSLVANMRYANAETDEERTAALKEHLLSIRKHIADLSSKNYQQLYQLNSLDFVLMFIPSESAFAAAVQADANLFAQAFEKNIVLVSPSTLLATLRTVSNIWNQENRNRNALEIARQSGELYDKFVGFVEDLQKVGTKLIDAQKAHDDALKKLHSGHGNLMNRAERLKKLGAKASKNLPPALLGEERSEEEERA